MANNPSDPNRKQGQQGGQRDRDAMKQEEARKREGRNRATEDMKNRSDEEVRRDRSKDASRLPE